LSTSSVFVASARISSTIEAVRARPIVSFGRSA
jgi:hypothetical protein